jgi:peptide/nickel transport system permease protein
LGSEYVRMARANGISGRSIVVRHAFKSASIQVVTLAGLVTISLLIGTVFVEPVFALPGLGLLIVTAVNGADLPMVQGVAVFFTLIVIAVNLLADVLYTVLNPKVRTG